MTVTLEIARVCVLVLFVTLTAKSYRRSRGGAVQAGRWLTASFAVLAGACLLGLLVPGVAARQGSADWKLGVCLLLLFPYCLGRFTASFGGTSAANLHARLRAGITTVLVLATLAMPALDGAPRRTGPYPLFAVLVMFGWTLLSGLSARSLWASGHNQPTVVRRRMRTLSLGSVMVNAALLLLGTAPPARPSVQLVAQILGMFGGWLFFVGFAPPAALRAFWRQPDVDLMHAGEGRLVAALDAEAVARVIVPQTAGLLGAGACFMTGDDGHALACYGITEAEAERVGAELTPAGDAPAQSGPRCDRLALPLGDGWLVAIGSAVTPAFGREELALFRALRHSAEMALERASLLERERAGQLALMDRERQLAQAQRLARVGSWEWELSSGRVVWSEEMYRIYELNQGALDGDPEYSWFKERSHPDDRVAMEEAVLGAVASGDPFEIDHRLLMADGRVRWLHSRGQVVRGPDGSPLCLQGTAQEITAAKEAEEKLAYQATHDPLTGLPNRTLLRDRLEQAAARARRRPAPLTVLFLDLDRFKVVNDGLGHGVGDELLCVVAERLVDAVRPEDTVARFGGDEFVVLCENLPTEDEARALAGRLNDIVAEPVSVAGRQVAITVSIGIVFGEAALTPPEELLRDADIAMYQAKDQGRARFAMFDAPARRRVIDRLDREVALNQALEKHELKLWYQPEVSLEDGRLIGLEALLRWEHPEWGVQLPEQFLPLAEETGLVLPIGTWALEEACRQAQAVRAAHPELASLVVWVNLSARQLAQRDLAGVIAGVLRSTGTAPDLLGLEITETVVMDDVRSVSETLRRLRRIGVRLAIDDFGTGFSSLRWLRQFPVDALKIDRSFVAGVTAGGGDHAIIEAVVGLASALDMTTVAEGVETQAQAGVLRSIGCEVAQGFYFAPPLAHAALLSALAGGGTLLPWPDQQPRGEVLRLAAG